MDLPFVNVTYVQTNTQRSVPALLMVRRSAGIAILSEMGGEHTTPPHNYTKSRHAETALPPQRGPPDLTRPSRTRKGTSLVRP